MKRTIILYLTSVTIFACTAKKDGEVFILPKDYTGYVVIIYNQKSGASEKLENGKIILEIPQDGILKIQGDADYEWKVFPEFYYENVSSVNKIPFKAEPENLPKDTVVAYGGVSGGANKDLQGKEVVRYRFYYIGNNAQIDSAYARAEKLDILSLAE